jgi:hypothetical protein
MPQLSHASPVMGRLIVPLLLCAWLLTQPALAADQYTLADLGAVQPIGMASDAPVVVGEANSHAMRTPRRHLFQRRGSHLGRLCRGLFRDGSLWLIHACNALDAR